MLNAQVFASLLLRAMKIDAWLAKLQKMTAQSSQQVACALPRAAVPAPDGYSATWLVPPNNQPPAGPEKLSSFFLHFLRKGPDLSDCLL